MTNDTDSVSLYLNDLEASGSLDEQQRQDFYSIMHSGAQVAAAHSHRALWRDALRLVPTIEARIRKNYGIEHADPDLLQEGNMACGRAVTTWEPDKGAFTTWIGTAVRGAILDYLNEQNKGGIGSKAAAVMMVDMHDTVAFGAEQTGTEDSPGMQTGVSGLSRGDALTYGGIHSGEDREGRDLVPEGFDDPEREAERAQLLDTIDALRDPLDREVLRTYYGFECSPKSLMELAKEHGYSITGIRKRLISAQEKVKLWLT